MDIKLKKRSWILRHKYYVAGALCFAGLSVWLLVLSRGPMQQHVRAGETHVARVEESDFLEYVEAEGVVHPILTLKINALVSGHVERIVAEEGSMLRKGDTILVLQNPDLRHEVEEQYDALQKQLTAYREQEIEMAQKSLTLQKQALQNAYETERLADSYKLDLEEHRMGVKSKAQLEVAEKEYAYKQQAARLELESLRHDSAATQIRRSLIQSDRTREQKKYDRIRERLQDLVVRAPIDGQLSALKIMPGQQISAGSEVGEVKTIDRYKVQASLDEYYIDRISAGLPATGIYRNRRYAMQVRKVVPEIVERAFPVDLVFADTLPDNLRIGRSLRVQVELGQPEQVVCIPRGDFYAATQGRWIYRLDASGKRAVKVPIRLGRQNPKQFEVLEGLSSGDRVLTMGYERMGEAEEVILDAE